MSVDARHHPEKIHPTAFVAPGAQVVGDVTLGAGSSIWYNAVIPAGMQVPPGSLVLGVPAKVIGQLKEERRGYLKYVVDRYRVLTQVHMVEQQRIQDMNA